MYKWIFIFAFMEMRLMGPVLSNNKCNLVAKLGKKLKKQSLGAEKFNFSLGLLFNFF